MKLTQLFSKTEEQSVEVKHTRVLVPLSNAFFNVFGESLYLSIVDNLVFMYVADDVEEVRIREMEKFIDGFLLGMQQ